MAELATFGLTLADVADDLAVEVWPDTQKAIGLFIAMRTQWRVGMSGLIGLDYCALPTVFRMQAIQRAEQPAAFDDLRLMEVETLNLVHAESGG